VQYDLVDERPQNRGSLGSNVGFRVEGFLKPFKSGDRIHDRIKHCDFIPVERIVAFSQTDFTEDLKKITVPVLVMHSEDDQIVPYVAAGPVCKAFEERDADNLQGLPARHAGHARRHDQCRSAGVPEDVTLRPRQ
jgi:pimeloyl-ACP methyl ester carboxylesterase